MSREMDYKLAADLVDRWKSVDCRSPAVQLTREAIANLETKIADALTTIRKEEREAALKSGRQALAAELLGHLDRITSTTAVFHLVKNLCKIELGQEPDSLGLKVE